MPKQKTNGSAGGAKLPEKILDAVAAEAPYLNPPRISQNRDVWLQETAAILKETSHEMVKVMSTMGPSSAPYIRVFQLVTFLAADTQALLQGKEPPGPPVAPPLANSDNDHMDDRITKLELALDYVKRDIGEMKIDIRELKKDSREDFRVIFGAVIAMGLALSGLMAKGFGWL